MRSSSRFLLASFVLSLVTACGGGAPVDDQRDSQRRDAQKLQDEYDRVQGTYHGVLTTGPAADQKLESEISLYVVYVQDGVNADGTPKVRPSLRGRIQLLGAISDTDTLTLSGDFDERNGRLTLTSASGGGSGAGSGGDGVQKILSATGFAVGGKVNLRIVRGNGVWGVFDGERTSSDAMAPGSGDVSDRRARLMAALKKVAGIYSGATVSSDGEKKPVEFNLFISEEADSTGTILPTLAAKYRRLDFPPGEFDYLLNVQYDSVSGEIYMRESKSTPPGIPQSTLYLSVRGLLVGATLDVMVTDRRGPLGRFRATRK